MNLNEIIVFAKVVQAGSFVGASRELEMPTSTVSRKVAELEQRLGARLLQRTTRKLSLTDVGQMYYQHAARIIGQLEEAEHAVVRMQEIPRGLLRVTVPLNFGYLGTTVASFLERHPEVQIEMVCADRVVDLIQEGFDVAIRAGKLADSTLVARSLGVLRSFVVASPAFLEKQGTPKQPEDLSRFDCIVFGAGPDRLRWKLTRGAETQTVPVRARLVVNDFEFLDQAARAGLGVTTLPAFRCVAQLREGNLRRVLPDWCSVNVPVHAVYPTTRQLSPTVKAFLDHLSSQLTPPPWERGPSP